MGDDRVKGTVTPLAETLSEADAAVVARRVAEAIQAQRQQLQTLQGYHDDNRALCNVLVQLPDLVSYDIMVPFGKAAFMPGRLIHTNEFLVLLGEGYYAERSAKQAVEILERRSEFLDSKINATKVHIGDLEAEATFVKNIADEAAAGVVEIKEEYTEPTEFSFQQTSPVEDATPVDGKVSADAEDAKIMARIAELELAEAAAEDDGTGSDDDNDAEVYKPFTPFQRLLLDEDEDEDEEGEDEEEGEDDDDEHEDFLQRLAQLPSSSSKGQAHFTSELYQQQPNRVPSEEHDKGTHEIYAAPHRVRFKDELNVERGASLSAQDWLPPRSHPPSTVHLQAFSGTVLERNPGNLSSNQSVAQEEENRPTRPVSKFKLRKGKDS
ncbi:unnamed protein product [Sphagnum jensenii]|uniref:RNA polymerase II subunit 5-mediating protein n=1 Tax=Sphagnum jensenii TaxID=128206 RepID=A0ABP1BLP1_9BRYO